MITSNIWSKEDLELFLKQFGKIAYDHVRSPNPIGKSLFAIILNIIMELPKNQKKKRNRILTGAVIIRIYL